VVPEIIHETDVIVPAESSRVLVCCQLDAVEHEDEQDNPIVFPEVSATRQTEADRQDIPVNGIAFQVVVSMELIL
jgi:hypothetical protein